MNYIGTPSGISVFAQHAISTYNEVGETLTLTGTVKATVEPTLAFTKDGEAINLTPNVELGTNANEVCIILPAQVGGGRGLKRVPRSHLD